MDEPKADLVTTAIAACNENIHKHTVANYIVIVGALVALGILGGISVEFADREGKVNRLEWRAAVSELIKAEERLATLQEQIDNDQTYLENSRLELAQAKSRIEESQKDDPNYRPTTDETERILRYQSDIEKEQKSVEVHTEALKERKQELAEVQKRLEEIEQTATPILPPSFIVGLCALGGVIIAVFSSLYRGHFQEIARNQHFVNGLQRIVIAARNGRNAGYQTDVRRALTSGAFDFDTGGLLGRNKKVENPVPGHPMYEMATAIVNKALEQALEKMDPPDLPREKT